MFAQKLGITIGGSLCGWILGSVGFDPDKTPSEEVIQSFRIIATILPGVLAIANGVVLFWYRLTDSQLKTIVAELEERRAAQDN